jgi:hypothetical protein
MFAAATHSWAAPRTPRPYLLLAMEKGCRIASIKDGDNYTSLTGSH